MPINLSDFAILNIKSANSRCVISKIRKNEALNFIQNIDLPQNSEIYIKNIIITYKNR